MSSSSALLHRSDIPKEFNLSVTTIDRWVKNGFWPEPIRIARSVMWRREDIEDFLDQKAADNFLFKGNIASSKLKEFLLKEKVYGTRWQHGEKRFGRPSYEVDPILENCKFSMNKLIDGESVLVDLNGENISLDTQVDLMKFSTARGIFYEDEGANFDGFSVVFPEFPEPIITQSNKELYLVGGIQKNCISISNGQITRSDTFMIDWHALGKPYWGLTPNLTGIFWFGLSEEFISSQESADKATFCSKGSIPITEWDMGEIKELPRKAQLLLKNWV